jgi:hypothetical protein
VVTVNDIMIYAEALYLIKRVAELSKDAQFVGYYIEKRQRLQAWVDRNKVNELLVCVQSTDQEPRINQYWHNRLRSPSNMRPLPWKSALNISRSSVRDFDHYRIDVNMEIKKAFDDDEAESVFLAGWCLKSASVSFYEITDIELHAISCADDLYCVRRVFLGWRSNEIEEDEEFEPETDKSLDREAELAKLEARNEPLSVSVISTSGDSSRIKGVLIKSLQNQGFNNSQSMLEVPIDELHCFHQGQEIRYDPQNAWAMLMHESSSWQASFRRVPPESIESFQKWSRTSVGDVFQPPSLIFIGKSDHQPTGSYRFEFGFGRVMEATEDRILNNGQPLSTVTTAIYHGDRIKALRFTKPSPEKLCIEIMGMDIAFGDPHQVFIQALRHQFVHILVTEAGSDGKPRVIAIKGFSEGGDRAQQQFSIPYASLTESSLEGWRERLRCAKKDHISLYARLNVDRFIETAGRICEFHPVVFAFGTEQGLRTGDRLLVEAGIMKRTGTGNDILLALEPLSEVVDGNPQVSRLIALRRDFSARESLLGRFLPWDKINSDALQGMVFAACIIDIRVNCNDAKASLLNMPARRWESLLGSLRSSSGSLFAIAAVVRPGKPNVVARIEVRPGVFFDVESDQLHGDLGAGLAPGTLVRVELAKSLGAPDKICLVPCEFSPWRYLSETSVRPGVALPTDVLLDNDASIRKLNWSDSGLFTAADFPKVKFSPAYWRPREKCWEVIIDRRLMPEFMALPHPKLVLLGRKKYSSRFLLVNFTDITAFAAKLSQSSDNVSIYLLRKLSDKTRIALKAHDNAKPLSESLQSLLVEELNAIIENGPIPADGLFNDIQIRKETQDLLQKKPQKDELIRLNRMLLEDAYSKEISTNRKKGQDGTSQAVFCPMAENIKVGFLCWDNQKVWMTWPDAEKTFLHWPLLSYTDTSVEDIKQRCRNRSWFIHDKQTSQWSDFGVRRPHIGRLTVAQGPLFFDNQCKENRLRYISSSLTTFGVPLGNITEIFGLDELDVRGTHVDVTVAAIQECDGRCDGIWIEWVPGRVIEIPVEMLTWRSGPDSLPLVAFDWSHLACGDELELRLVAGEALAPDRIELVAWRRGPRGACVPPNGSAALLPCKNATKGKDLRLGSGAFQLTLPFVTQNASVQAYWLPTSNLLEPFADQKLRMSDIVLLEVNTRGKYPKLMVAGMSDVEALPDQHMRSQVLWSEHPLAEWIIRRGTNQKISFHLPAIVDLIQAAGGALPVTIEGTDDKNGIVWFSFRHQKISIKRHGIAQALVLGASSDMNRAALWLGRGVCFVPLHDIVNGLPLRLWSVILRKIAAMRIPVWVMGQKEGDTQLRFGVANDAQGDLWVVPVAAIGDGDDIAGLLVRSCKSQRLYWIPQEYLAWSDLKLDEIFELFDASRIRPDQALRARLMLGNDGFAKMSLLDTAEARREQNDLYPGHELRVVVESITSGPEDAVFRYWLVRSLDTGLLLRCDVPVELVWNIGDTRLVKVVSRRFRQTYRVTCVPQGRRTIPIILPQAVIEQITAITAEPRPSPWREETSRCSQMSTEDLLVGPPRDALLNIRLVWAWELCVKRSGFDKYVCEAAVEWISKNQNSSASFLCEAIMASSILCTLVAAGPRRILTHQLQYDEAAECLRHWWIRASMILGQLHGRIIRSLHLGILMSRLTRTELESDKRFAARYERLLRLLSAAPLFQRDRAEIIRLADQLLMDMGENRHEFAGALISCFGKIPPSQAMQRSDNAADPVTHFEQLARVCAPFANVARSRNQDRLPEAPLVKNIAACLNAALATCHNQNWDMVLLGELAPVLNPHIRV